MSFTTTCPAFTASANGTDLTGSASSSASTALQTSGGAEPPNQALSLKPLKMGGLWLAVSMTPPMPPCFLTTQDTAGVGVGRSVSVTVKPLPARISAVRWANSFERNRRS